MTIRRTALLLFTGMVLLLVHPSLMGCSSRRAERAIAAGDRVRVEYTCTLPNGDLVATTDDREGRDRAARKSVLFVAGEMEARSVLTAGPTPSASGGGQPKGFRSALIEKLSETLVGMKVGEIRKIALSASVENDLKDSERFLQMARVRKRTKEKILTRDFFLRFSKGEPPDVGRQVRVEPGLLGTVSSFDEKNVTLRITPEGEKEIDTDFGKGKIRDKDGHYEIELDVRPGTLVRIGPLVGRVSEVNEETFTLDFGHPFGGQVLLCTIRAVALEESAGRVAEGARPGSRAASQEEGVAKRVEDGDVASVEYTIRMASGERLAAESGIPLSGVEVLWAGRDSSVPGLSRAVVGMREGERKTVRIPAEEAYGARDLDRILTFPRIRRTPRILRIRIEEFAKTFGAFPQEGQELHWVPYFESRVASVTVRDVTLENREIDRKRFEEDHGTTEVSVQGDEIVTRLDPKIGAPFEHERLRGRIVSADEGTFTVDFNHPLAGETLEVELFVSSLTKAEEFRAMKIPWIEDHDQGLETARVQIKPAVLVLYASDCPWSQKLLTETLEDPRVKALKDGFVWIKVDSAHHADLQAVYEQASFPAVLLLSPTGTVLGRHEGFLTAHAFLETLDQWTAGSNASS